MNRIFKISSMSRVTLGLSALLACGAISACDKQGDKQAVEDMVNQRLDAEKTKQMAEDYIKVKEENTTLKARVAELEKQLGNAQARLAQTVKTEKTDKAAEQAQIVKEKARKAVTGAKGSM